MEKQTPDKVIQGTSILLILDALLFLIPTFLLWGGITIKSAFRYLMPTYAFTAFALVRIGQAVMSFLACLVGGILIIAAVLLWLKKTRLPAQALLLVCAGLFIIEGLLLASGLFWGVKGILGYLILLLILIILHIQLFILLLHKDIEALFTRIPQTVKP